MGTGINGLSVGIVTVGSLLVYAGIRGVSPLQALRDVTSGQPVSIPNTGGEVTGGNVASDGQPTMKGRVTSVTALAAVASFASDKYSRLNREKSGYSDCSSFVCKGFHAVGVAKPDGRMAWPNTTAFAVAPAWKTIPQAETMPGDIAVVSGHHMVFITAAGASQAIGQQNSRTNVKTGTITELFASVPGPIVYRTYVGV